MAKMTITLTLKVDSEFKERLDVAAQVTDRPYARIVRDSVTKELDRLSKRYPVLRRDEELRDVPEQVAA